MSTDILFWFITMVAVLQLIYVRALIARIRNLQERMAVVESNIVLLRPDTFSKG